MKKDVFGLGMMQFTLTTAAITVAAAKYGLSASTALVIGGGGIS